MDLENFISLYKAVIESEDPEQEVKKFFDNIDKFKVLASFVVDWLIASLGPECKKITRSIIDGVINNRKESVEKYISVGFTREEAILFVLNDAAHFQKALDEYNSKIRSSS